MKSTKKLYVWEGVLTDWSDGIVIALASSEDQARAAVADDDEVAGRHIAKIKPRVFSTDRKNSVAFVMWGGG